jgi:ABC-type sugar transport system permease subunit
MWIVCVVAVITVVCGFLAWYYSASSAWMSTVTQNEKNTVLYAENSLTFVADEANARLNALVQSISSDSGESIRVLIDRAEIALKDSFLYACVYDADGTLAASKGGKTPKDFEFSNFYETLLYSDGYALSEVSYDTGVLHLQTASILEDGSVILLGLDVLSDYIRRLNTAINREYWLFYGDEEQFVPIPVTAVSEPFYEDSIKAEYSRLFKTTTDSQRPSSTILPLPGRRVMITSTALYDADHWDVKGFLVQVTPNSFWEEGSNRLGWFVWIGSLLSCFIAPFFLLRMYRKKTSDTSIHVNKIYFIYAIAAFIPVFIFLLYGTFRFTPSLLREYESSSMLTNGRILYQDIQQRYDSSVLSPKSLIEQVKKVTRDEYQIRPVENTSQLSASTTLSSRKARLISQYKSSIGTNEIEIGTLNIDRIGQTYARFTSHGVEWQIFHEDTAVSNEILSVQFLGVILLLVFLVVTLIFGFLTYHLHDRLLIRNTFFGYLFLAPALVHLIWWAAGPLGFSLFLAFRRWSVVDPAKPFVGLDNFIELFQDGNFWNALKNTAVYSLYVPIGMLFSLLLAMAVNKAGKIAIALRVLYYLPVVTAGVATTIVWKWIFNRDFGILNYILGWFGIDKIAWIDSPQFALLSIMIISIWQAIGSQLLIFLAGLQGIPIDFYDAAKVDGAGKYKIFRHITLPLLKPTTLFVLVTSIIGSFQVFTPVYVLTQGGPLRSTDVVFYHIWKAAWTEMRMGYAAAQSWILFLLLMILTYFEFKLYGKDSWQAYF